MSGNLSNTLCAIRIEHDHNFNVISARSNYNIIKISIIMDTLYMYIDKIGQKVIIIKIIYMKSHLCDIIFAWMQTVHI